MMKEGKRGCIVNEFPSKLQIGIIAHCMIW